MPRSAKAEPLSARFLRCLELCLVSHGLQSKDHVNREYTYRLEFYWKGIAIYAVALIGYALVRGLKEGMSSGRIQIVLMDPLLILLLAFILLSSLGLLISWLMKRSLVVDERGIILRNRFRERVISIDDISKMSIGREKIIKVRGAFKLVKIRLRSRRRLLRIRTSSFHDEHDLVQSLVQLREVVVQHSRNASPRSAG